MRLAFSSVAAACLLIVSAAATSSASGVQADDTCAGASAASRVFVHDDFLDADMRGSLLSSLSVDRIDDGRYQHLRVSASLSERVMAALGRFASEAGGHAAVAEDTVVVPFTEHVGDEPEHHDHHRDGGQRGQMAEGHVGVVYLEGEGDFVFTDTATGAEERVPIAPGKMISWPNQGFRHRVEAHGSMPRRLLGPMVLDVASGSLLGVGIISTSSPSSSPTEAPSTAPTVSPSSSPTEAPSTAPTVSPLVDPITISAASSTGSTSVRRGSMYTILITLRLPAADSLGRRELLMKASTGKHAINSTIYALLLEAPGADNATCKRTSVHPRLKPASLKKPAVQTGGDLLWSKVAMPLYASKPSKRTFKVTFKVGADAISPVVFTASVWKNGIKLQTATPVQVVVTSKSG